MILSAVGQKDTEFYGELAKYFDLNTKRNDKLEYFGVGEKIILKFGL